MADLLCYCRRPAVGVYVVQTERRLLCAEHANAQRSILIASAADIPGLIRSRTCWCERGDGVHPVRTPRAAGWCPLHDGQLVEECGACGGQGRVDVSDPGGPQHVEWEKCKACDGLGYVDARAAELRRIYDGLDNLGSLVPLMRMGVSVSFGQAEEEIAKVRMAVTLLDDQEQS